MHNALYSAFNFFRFMYSGVAVTNDNVFLLLSASKKFKMAHLQELCDSFLMKSAGIDNVCGLMEQAVGFESSALKEKCLEIFSEQTTKVILSQAFYSISQPALSAFLDAEETDILEIDIFWWVRKWMVEQCKVKELPVTGPNMREVIGDALYKLRFPTMTQQDFANSVAVEKGFLTESEIAGVFLKISLFDSSEVECPFSSKLRCKRSHYRTEIDTMQKLCETELVIDSNTGDKESVESLLLNMKDVQNGKDLRISPLRILVQCPQLTVSVFQYRPEIYLDI